MKMITAQNGGLPDAALELTLYADDLEGSLNEAVQAEIESHQEYGFYVPTRQELLDTTGDYFLHLLTERE